MKVAKIYLGLTHSMAGKEFIIPIGQNGEIHINGSIGKLRGGAVNTALEMISEIAKERWGNTLPEEEIEGALTRLKTIDNPKQVVDAIGQLWRLQNSRENI